EEEHKLSPRQDGTQHREERERERERGEGEKKKKKKSEREGEEEGREWRTEGEGSPVCLGCEWVKEQPEEQSNLLHWSTTGYRWP
ncbi:hypothetical protein DKP78_18135, partial [Enterococcus faecium]